MSDKLSGVRMFSRGLVESSKQGAAFGGEAVFLRAAVGFFGDGAFDEVGGKGLGEFFKRPAFWKGAGAPYWHKRGFAPGRGRRNRGGRGRSEWL